MPLYNIQATLKGKSGIPEDVYVNNFHVECAEPIPEDDEINVLGRVWDFYNAPLPSGRALRDYLSPAVQQNGHTLKLYKLDEAPPRVPRQTSVRNFDAAPAGTPLPEEVAVVLSYRAALVSGTVPARRRGRLYFGPLDTSAVQAEANSRTQVTQNLRDDLLLCGDRLWNALRALDPQVQWVVHSPTSGGLSRFPIAHLWIDDAFDTQRRRGRTAQVRHEWVLPQP